MEKIILEKLERDLPTYDFKDEFLDLLKEKESQLDANDNFRKFFAYKLHANSLKIDCDVSKLAVNIYKNAWDFLRDSIELQKSNEGNKLKFELKLNNKIYLGDTMTSAWGPFRRYLKVYYRDDLDSKGKVPNPEGKNNIERWYNFILKCPKKIEDDYVLEFLRLTHTIGNFSPVPENFNVGRSGHNAEWDYWDLTLLCIYNWYKDNDLRILYLNETEDKYLNKLFSKSNCPYESVRKCKEWLYIFKTWDSFVEQNFFQDFVYKTDDIYGQPIMFWSNHSYHNPSPGNLEEFKEFFEKANKMIKKRGEKINEKLQKQIK